MINTTTIYELLEAPKAQLTLHKIPKTEGTFDEGAMGTALYLAAKLKEKYHDTKNIELNLTWKE